MHFHIFLLVCWYSSLVILCDRPVTDADIRSAEKKMTQLIDMIMTKKKRIALIERKQRLNQTVFLCVLCSWYGNDAHLFTQSTAATGYFQRMYTAVTTGVFGLIGSESILF